LSKKHRDKIKNKRKHAGKNKEAARRKQQAIDEMAELGLSLDMDTFSLGIVFEDLGISQASFFGINQVNQLCRKYVGIDIQLFVQHALRACIDPLCPVDDSRILLSWRYPLIATSVSSCIDAIASQAPMICHYVIDIDFFDRYDLSTNDLRSTFCDSRIKVVVRHEDYKELIQEEFGIQVCEQVIPDFDLAELMKLIILETQNV